MTHCLLSTFSGTYERFAMPRNSNAPSRANPLRQPGQSLREAHNELLTERLVPLGTIILVLWLVAGFQWVWMIRGVRPSPAMLTAFAALITLYGMVRTYPLLRTLRHLMSGYRGERAVGEYLDRLRMFGYRIYHDVPAGLPGDGGNIDHVIISTRGVYTVETNTKAKPAKEKNTAVYDGRAVSFNGGLADTAPIIHAEAQAARLARLLRQVAGCRLPVRPLVVVPGWQVEHDQGDEDAPRTLVHVMAPEDLFRWIEQQAETLSADVTRQASSQLATFIRKST